MLTSVKFVLTKESFNTFFENCFRSCTSMPTISFVVVLNPPLNPLFPGILMNIDHIGALRAQRATLPSGFSQPYSVQAPFYLW